MNRDELVDALRELDARLTAPCDVIVIGGAAMILHFDAPRATRDIDVVLLNGDAAQLRAAVVQVARARNLPEHWLSDAAKGFADILPPDFAKRLVPLDFGLRHLKLYALGRAEQAALKIIALREQDLEDLDILLPRLTLDEKRILTRITRHVATFRQDWAQRLYYFLQERNLWTE